MRLIDADALIERIEKQRELLRPHIYESDAIGDAAYRGTEEIIEHFPTVDAVPVVRCRDCIYYEFGKSYTPSCNHNWIGHSGAKESDFCSFGDRKEVSK